MLKNVLPKKCLKRSITKLHFKHFSFQQKSHFFFLEWTDWKSLLYEVFTKHLQYRKARVLSHYFNLVLRQPPSRKTHPPKIHLFPLQSMNLFSRDCTYSPHPSPQVLYTLSGWTSSAPDFDKLDNVDLGTAWDLHLF